MDGLIINQPYANMIIKEEKKWELRNRKPPSNKINSEIYLLSKGNMLGTIKIVGTNGPLDASTLKKNYIQHKTPIESIDDDYESYVWELEVCKTFSEPQKYFHPAGAQVWVKNVIPYSKYMEGKITNYF